jgi:MoxR-like ATPase
MTGGYDGFHSKASGQMIASRRQPGDRKLRLLLQPLVLRPGNPMRDANAASLDLTVRFIHDVRGRIGSVVVGQDVVVERLLIALFTGGHLLLQGVPGLAKTLLVAALSRSIDLTFARIQFTIDLLPSDILGSEVLDQRNNEFRTHKGPVFTNLLLADEINRAAPKVQGALLEAMQERKVTIGKETHKLPAPFLVIATQNPVEHSGTFELPEAQLDRFMLCHRLDSRLRKRSARCCGAISSWESAVRTRAPSRSPNSMC